MNFLRRLLVLALTLTMIAPMAMAHEVSSQEKPLSIMDADIYTRQGLLRGNITVCNENLEATRFSFQAQNLDIGGLYVRNFQIGANDCEKFNLRFTEDFSLMANVDDTVKLAIKRIKGLSSKVSFKYPDDEYTTIVEGKGPHEGCLDSHGGDGAYLACTGDFIYHESGLRVRVLDTDYRSAKIMVAGIRWGGTKKMTINKNRKRRLYVGDKPSHYVEIENVYDPMNRHLLTLNIETLY